MRKSEVNIKTCDELVEKVNTNICSTFSYKIARSSTQAFAGLLPGPLCKTRKRANECHYLGFDI